MKDKDGIPASTNTKVAIEIKRTRRTPTQLFTDAVKERKEELVALIRAIGGKWKKKTPKGSVDSFVYFRSERLVGVSILICRETVCEKVVTFKCKPLFSPDEESEFMADEASA